MRGGTVGGGLLAAVGGADLDLLRGALRCCAATRSAYHSDFLADVNSHQWLIETQVCFEFAHGYDSGKVLEPEQVAENRFRQHVGPKRSVALIWENSRRGDAFVF